MIDANELVAAIKRARQGNEGKPLHLVVPVTVPAELVAVLAQLDVKVVVSDILVPGAAFLINATERHFWDMRPPPRPMDYRGGLRWLP